MLEAVPVLQERLRGELSPEVRSRLLQVAGGEAGRTGVRRRRLRALRVLEWIGTPEARAELSAIAKSSLLEEERREAAAALGRLGTRK